MPTGRTDRTQIREPLTIKTTAWTSHSKMGNSSKKWHDHWFLGSQKPNGKCRSHPGAIHARSSP